MRAVFALPAMEDEQKAPFEEADEATVKATRLEIERHKARLREATPIPPSTNHEGQSI